MAGVVISSFFIVRDGLDLRMVRIGGRTGEATLLFMAEAAAGEISLLVLAGVLTLLVEESTRDTGVA